MAGDYERKTSEHSGDSVTVMAKVGAGIPPSLEDRISEGSNVRVCLEQAATGEEMKADGQDNGRCETDIHVTPSCR